ncbi:nucleotidyltransferase [Butyrivibrio sp. AE3004]|uniref:nucleotidyltransferase n=1 Tax=Butyrivibrio sp. AE3004 TaxID=1506994 RepID=UPI0004943B72|nr:nucleotidyltransferase [Butyrivibrio sp. AE3004]
MKTVGIVAEFNPFHYGHEYLIRTLKEQTGSDYAVVIMSGDYTQRGAPAIFDKYARTKMALLCGADLVLELPVYYSTSSAEFFAGGAISILNNSGCIDFLGFGSESGNVKALENIASVLLDEPEEYSFLLKENLKSGKNYAAARSCALSSYLGSDISVISNANDILGTEYIKALKLQKSSIVPFCIKRKGSSYDDVSLSDTPDIYSSAKAIRFLIESEGFSFNDPNALTSYIPKSAVDVLKETIQNSGHFAMHIDDFSDFMHFKLLSEKNNGFDKYLDVSSDLSDKITSHIAGFSCITDFTAALKSKDITYTRISRALLHILLGMTKESFSNYVKDKERPCSYIRILGLNKNASPLLKKLQECSSIPVISKLSDAYKALPEREYMLLKETVAASNIYDLVSGKSKINEFAKAVITVNR